MILRKYEGDPILAYLRTLIEEGNDSKEVKTEVIMRTAGEVAQKQASYVMDLHFYDTKRTCVIHDFRFVIDGFTCQIDTLLIHQTMNIFVVETKHVSSELRIEKDGSFTKYNKFKGCYEGMSSPIEQNARHIRLLEKLIARLRWPICKIHNLVLVSDKTVVKGGENLRSGELVKLESACNKIQEMIDSTAFISSVVGFIRSKKPDEYGSELLYQHVEEVVDEGHWRAKKEQVAETRNGRKISETQSKEGKAVIKNEREIDQELQGCKHCGSKKTKIEFGKFGYYNKCMECDGNSPLKKGCEKPCKCRVRKQKTDYFVTCEKG